MNFLLNSCVFAEAAAVNLNGIKTLLANGLSTFQGNPVFINGPKSLPKNPRGCTI